MKRLAFVIGLLITAAAVTAQGVVTVSYDVNRIKTHGSNQIAVWVEDMDGNYVKSLYASRFTANGGYKRRPVSLSRWVKKSGWEKASRTEVDAVSGATQQAGKTTVRWDCTDSNGKSVRRGKYVIKMEGNICDDRKMYSDATIDIAKKSDSAKGTIIFEPENAADDLGVLFDNVVVTYKRR